MREQLQAARSFWISLTLKKSAKKLSHDEDRSALNNTAHYFVDYPDIVEKNVNALSNLILKEKTLRRHRIKQKKEELDILEEIKNIRELYGQSVE